MDARTIASAALAVGMLLVPLGGAVGAESLSPESRLIQRGKSLYGVYCAGCHGDVRDGEGSAGRKLPTRPADLRQIARRNGGEFPFPDVYQAIAGFDDTHVKRDMPRWGYAFQELDTDADQQDQVRGRILQLIYYLESIQEETERSDDRIHE